jgi:hypothetical protein
MILSIKADVRLDWAIHHRGIGVQHGLEDGSECGLLALAWDAKSYNAGSLKTSVKRVSDKTEGTLIGGQRMAQTRRMGKRNRRAYLLSAPRFSPYRSGQTHADRSLRPFPVSPHYVGAHGRPPDLFCPIPVRLSIVGGQGVIRDHGLKISRFIA